MPKSGPIASRTAATRATTASHLRMAVENCISSVAVHLHRGEAARRPPRARRCDQSAGRSPPIQRVDPDPVAHRAAQQLVHRHAQRLALDVPQRLVDAGERAHMDRRRRDRSRRDTAPSSDPRSARVLADQIVGQLVHARPRPCAARPSTTGSPQPMMPSSVSIFRNSQRGGTMKVVELGDLHHFP